MAWRDDEGGAKLSLVIGAPAPWFVAFTRQTETFHFSAGGGRYILVAILPDAGERRDEAMVRLLRARPQFDDQRISAFAVLGDRTRFDQTADQLPGLRWIWDRDGAIARSWGATDAEGRTAGLWALIDPSLRVLDVAAIDEADRIFAAVEKLGSPEDHAGTPLNAPVLIVPRVFEPELCQRLVDVYESRGGAPSGVMRERGGKTLPFLDASKNRRDAIIEDETLQALLRRRLAQRLLPEIKRAFQFQVTRIERYIVACYDAEEGGFFRAHRDDTTPGTAHRRFACSINLNAEDFEGGDLIFPEFGRRSYRPPTGGAVVFSCSLLHEATRVTRGRRYAFLPFFYDEAAEAIRQANLASVTHPQERA
jgi:predicted 2-oxoglutarate/Fe(II)-dependent dioxygenase YbiX